MVYGCGVYIFLGFCIGAALGSFANAAAMRTVAEKKWWGGERSVCDSCGERLSSCDLIPVVSYILLQGRCRRCRAKIPPRHFLAELAGGLFCALSFWRFGLSPAFFFCVAATPFLAFNTLTDLDSGYIYDSWALAMAAAGMAARIWGGPPALLDGAAGAAAGFGFIGLIILLSRGRMGLGDAMLMLGIGAFMGLKLTLLSLYLGFMCGGAVVIPLLLAGRVTRKTAVPLGPFLCAGMAAAIFFGEKILTLFGYPASWPWFS
ncbi:MAG: prepilin peptidase [Synergistaceae bacterium]|nr:prepilin peptidase [Synergistaceae bacterium]